MKTTRSLSISSIHPPASRTLSRRERHSADVRQRLFDAAMHLVAQRGFQATTVEEITQAADVGKGTFFNYFPSKEELLNSFGEIRLGKVRAALEAAKTGRESIATILRRLELTLAEDPGRSGELARSILLTLLSSETVREQGCARLKQAQSMFAQIFALGQKRGEVRRHVSAAELARFYKETHFGALLLWSLEPTGSLAAAANRSFDLFWASAAARPRTRAKKGIRQ
jgi:AcrR family transcriptional regulator